MSSKSNTQNDILIFVLTLLGIIILIKIFTNLKKDVDKNVSTDIVSGEGREVLANKEKRESLKKAIEHYHKEGNWDLLSKINE
ncbi:hypothetical protein [Brumimicrobium sp.]|uniref:hypothetical protein n=1 Tax=Brumimicrobium sp. TaxID=2029867 RepID=UPI003A94E0B0